MKTARKLVVVMVGVVGLSVASVAAQKKLAKVAPLDSSLRQVSVYDPKLGQWKHVDTCFSTHHLQFASDAIR